MRILMLTQWFSPEPFYKGLAFVKELSKLGHHVEVLTGFPNYPEGKIYQGYCVRFFQREKMEGISVLRVPLYPSHDNSAFKRVLNYASFAVSSALIGSLTAKRPDVIYAYHPPASIGLPSAVFKVLRNVPVVYDIQDLWPDTLSATGMLPNKAALRMVEKWCQFIYRRVDKIVVLSEGFKRVLSSRGVPAEKLEVVYNWCEEDQIPPPKRDESLASELGLAGRFNILFAGTMGKAQSLDSVLIAASHLATRCPSIQFVFIGGGVEVSRLKRRAQEMRLTNVLFLPRRPMTEIGQILALADVLLVHLKDDPLFRITIPSKTQAYMSAGRPILMAVEGESAYLVKTARAGVICRPEDPQSLVEAVEQLFLLPRAELDAMGANGRKFYLAEFCMKIGVRRIERILQSACASNYNDKQLLRIKNAASG
jgi:glycosyltransferase involved in cell wall biosynthesis